MYLSKIEMDLTDSHVRAALRVAQQMHRMMAAILGTARKDSELLYRYRTQGTRVQIYLYSSIPVNEKRIRPGMTLSGQRDMAAWLDKMFTGQILGFDLLTMPFKKVPAEANRNSRRRVLRSQEERFAWLTRKAEQNGFSLLDVRENTDEKLYARHGEEKGGILYLDVYHYTGTLQIKELSAFQRAVETGIGPGKAYGLGMIMLAER